MTFNWPLPSVDIVTSLSIICQLLSLQANYKLLDIYILLNQLIYEQNLILH